MGIIPKLMARSQSAKYRQGGSRSPRYSNYYQLGFGGCMIIIHIGASLYYFFYGTPATTAINVSSMITAVFLAMLVIVGFGLYMSYLKYLLWTGVGVALMLTCISIVLYPLLNAFWTKASIFDNPRLSDSFSNQKFRIFLANNDNNLNTGNSITGAIRCALAAVVGSSGIVGRSSPLQIFILGVIATITFELNRQLAAQIGLDYFGSFTIFGFGGFLSAGVGLVFLFMEPKQRRPKQQLSGTPVTAAISLLGSLLIFLFVPVLSFQGDNSMKTQLFTGHASTFSLILSMGAALVTSAALSIIIGGVVALRDIQNGLVAGAVVGGSASYFVTNPAYAIIPGIVAAFFQPIFELILEKAINLKCGLFCTYPPAVFGLQALVSAGLTALYCLKVNNGASDNLSYTQPETSPGSIMVVFFISAGIGFFSGVLVGLICKLIRPKDFQISLQDQQFWSESDQLGHDDSSHIGQLGPVNGARYAPEVSDRLRREEQLDMIRIATDIEEMELELDFVDMLQVIQ